MEYILSENLKRNKNSITKIIIVTFVSVVILNLLITLTNNIGTYKNTISIFLVLGYCFVMYFVLKKMIFLYVYNLGESFINFARLSGWKSTDVLTINFRDIKVLDKYENIKINYMVQKTYFFIYGINYNDCYYCEYETNNKIYRFVFKPSERLIRILERKIGNKNYEHGKDWINWWNQKI